MVATVVEEARPSRDPHDLARRFVSQRGLSVPGLPAEAVAELRAALAEQDPGDVTGGLWRPR